MVAWRWAQGGVEFDGKLHGYTPRMEPRDVADLIEKVNRVAEMKDVLAQGRNAFGSGQANYVGCATNLEQLILGRRTSLLAWMELLGRLGGYFQPRIDPSKLGEEESTRFAYEATLHIAQHLDAQLKKPDELEEIEELK